MKSVLSRGAGLSFAIVAAIVFAGCGGGGGGGGDAKDDSKDLVVIDVSVGGNDGVAINKVVSIEFSAPIAAGSVSAETVRVRLGPNFAKQVPGTYNVLGNIVEFAPRLPTQADLSDSGFAPGSTYQIELPGSPAPNTVRNTAGDALGSEETISFSTATASSPNLFIDYHPDTAPHVTAVNPKADAVDVPQDGAIEATLSEPIHPASANTSNVSLVMTERPPGTALSPKRVIQGNVVLEQSRGSVIMKFVPLFPLADNAKYELSINRRVTDLVGNDLVEHVSSFTIRDEPPVPGQFDFDFGPSTDAFVDVDMTIASWNEDVPGQVSAIFTAGGGDGTDGDFKPTFDTELDGDDQTGGVFNFRVVEIPAGVTVTVKGSTPVTILSLANMKIQGTLDASGAKGADSEQSTTNSVIPATPGGAAGPGGGAGGAAEHVLPTVTSASSWPGPDGRDGLDGYGTNGTGGQGSTYGNPNGYYYKMGAGGGGGGHITKGTDGLRTKYNSTSYQSKGGPGGKADGSTSLDPMTAGGGGGGGTQGRYAPSRYNNGASAGGGGGGGLTLGSANNIDVDGGSILADGGDGGRQVSSGTYCGGTGGGGAGGGIYLKSLRSVILSNATVSALGGAGGTGGNPNYTGLGSKGGNGIVRIHDGDASPTTNGSTKVSPAAYGKGTYAASGAGAPSTAQTLWINTGVVDPTFQDITGSDLIQTIPKAGQTIKIEIQMAPEDNFDLGNPDEDLASSWVDISEITTKGLNGNGYSYFKLRITFTLASDQELDDPLPAVDHLTLRYIY